MEKGMVAVAECDSRGYIHFWGLQGVPRGAWSVLPRSPQISSPSARPSLPSPPRPPGGGQNVPSVAYLPCLPALFPLSLCVCAYVCARG